MFYIFPKNFHRKEGHKHQYSGSLLAHHQDDSYEPLHTLLCSIRCTDQDTMEPKITHKHTHENHHGKYGTLVINLHTGNYTYSLGTTSKQKMRVHFLSSRTVGYDTFIIRLIDADQNYVEEILSFTIIHEIQRPHIQVQSHFTSGNNHTSSPSSMHNDAHTITETLNNISFGSIHFVQIQLDILSLASHIFSINGIQAQGVGHDIAYEGFFGNLHINGQKGSYSYALSKTPEQKALLHCLCKNKGVAQEDFIIGGICTHKQYSHCIDDILTIHIHGTENVPHIEVNSSLMNIFSKEMKENVEKTLHPIGQEDIFLHCVPKKAHKPMAPMHQKIASAHSLPSPMYRKMHPFAALDVDPEYSPEGLMDQSPYTSTSTYDTHESYNEDTLRAFVERNLALAKALQKQKDLMESLLYEEEEHS